MEYFVRYNNVTKKKIVPLQLKINNFSFGKLYMLRSGITLVPIESNDDKFFRKYSELWNKITELIVIDDSTDFVETTLDDNEDEFIILNVEKKYKYYQR